MRFESGMYKITKILKKTKAKFFKELGVEDCIWFTIDLKNTTGASSGIYATSIKCHLRNSDLKVVNSQNLFLRNIANFELKRII